MSLGGPCLWVPSLSSSVPSSLSTVTSRWSGGARHGDQTSSVSRTSSPFLSCQKPRDTGSSVGVSAEMWPAGPKAEDASTSSAPGRTSQAGLYSEGEIPSDDPLAHKSGAEKVGSLPRVKLEIPGGNDAGSTSRPQTGSDHLGETMDTSQLDLDTKHETDQESTVSPSDEKSEAGGGEGSHRSPSLEKKKMKRFRLTHNQTRFLMSEFTRQAHPDAAHRERLSREIPGLTPRQVQVWFQNRRAKLKRLTTNDRERVLRSRALPEDFDTTKVLRTPFEGKSNGQTPIASPQDYGFSNPDFSALRGLRADGFQRSSDDDYLVSPLGSTSAAGTYMSPAGQGRVDGLTYPGMMFNRPAASASMDDLHRTIRADHSLTRPSSLSDASSHPPSFHSGLPISSRFAATPNQAAMSYARQPLDYGVSRQPAGMVAYDQNTSFEGSGSPIDTQRAQVTYDLSNLGTQPQSYQSHLAISAPEEIHGLGIGSQMPAHARTMPGLQSVPVSTASEYRPYSYTSSSGPLGTVSYTQAGASSLSHPTSFAPSESGPVAHDPTQQTTQDVDLRSRFGTPSFNYANYIPQ